MSAICNKQNPKASARTGGGESTVDRVDAPVARGSAHFMRAGAELHLLHADLELQDTRMAAARVSSAHAAVAAAVAVYEEAHQLADELGFYAVYDEHLRSRHGMNLNVAEILDQAASRGLVQIDGKSLGMLQQDYTTGGDRMVFTSFISDVSSFAATLAQFDPEAADQEPGTWQEFAWAAITTFDSLRTRGQAIAIINTFTSERESVEA